MRLGLSDARELPLAAALVEGDDVLAATPEWTASGPGTVAYAVRRTRLLVTPHDAPLRDAALLSLLLDELDAAAARAPGGGIAPRMLATSLRLVAGREVHGTAGIQTALEHAAVAIRNRTGLSIDIATSAALGDLTAPDVVALVLVQLAVNAERHDGARWVRLEWDRQAVSAVWEGTPASVSTARRREDRTRWGLGFARIAADSLGATLHPPHCRPDGLVAATLELGVPRLALPLALLRGSTVERATWSWQEETGVGPGAAVHRSARLGDLVASARAQAGTVCRHAGWTARATGELVWLAIPPDGTLDRARDVLAGLVHEQALLRAAGELAYARIRGAALLLGACLGTALPRVPALAWRSRLERLLALAGSEIPVPRFEGIGAMDPDAVLLLTLRAGAGFEVAGDQLWLRLSDSRRGDAAVQPLLQPGEGRVALA